MTRKIGVLTGTFDPVHLGHIELARAAAAKFGLERVLLWVNAGASHKQGVTAYEARAQMVRLAAAGDALFEVIEGELAGRPHIYQTFVRLREHYPGCELIYLLGADILATIPRWEDARSVVEMATFAVAERPGSSKAVSEMVKGLGELGSRLKFRTFEFDDHMDASSQQIREAVRRGLRPQSLDPRVFEYIREHGLYR